MQMQASRTEADALSALDMTPEELKVYESLLERPGSTPAEVVVASGIPVVQVRRLLSALENQGLVTRSPERIARYHAVAPEVAFGALVALRQSGLKAALTMAERLAKIRPTSCGDRGDELTVELITGRAALLRTICQFYDMAKHEIMEFDRPPYLNSYESHSATHLSMQDRHVHCRTICDTSKLDWPGGAQHIQDCLAAGEEQRLYEGVPIKAAIIDRRMALVPLHLKAPIDSGLLLRPSLLLDTLCAYFDIVWELSVPVGADGDLGATAGRSDSANLEQLAALLASGLKDHVIASRLQISERTFERRVALLQKRLKATTRFQAGWNAALRMKKNSTKR
ncbi:hypothetical protein DVT68_07310 [Dyella solisilvae]|uniref:HTH luxR-type domain-containing protein n=1 Tax=Dyella solisilvae TaxID=1920168 RepID=A0A370KD52_9GAMM|nr:helix-turn-helix domain-containing protein [Dyella solisilvae]RDJ00585.1 hypothetical protein DVT68_07310 [Dyella solisilvae]